MSKIIIIAKGNSLLNSNLGNQIDNFDKIIRVNHMPEIFNQKDIGSKTHIFCGRFYKKILKVKDKLNNVSMWHAHPKSLVSKYQDKTQLTLDSLNKEQIEYMNEEDLELIKKHFNKSYIENYSKSLTDLTYDMCFPDTGFSTIIMCLNRFKNYEIFVAGFDNYKNKNKNIYEIKTDDTIFRTPVLSQEIFYKKMLSTKKIYEFK